MIVPRSRIWYLPWTPDGWGHWSNDRKRWFYLAQDMRRWWGWFLLPREFKEIISDYYSKTEFVEDSSARLTFAADASRRRPSKVIRC